MSQAINCNYARAGIRTLYNRKSKNGHKLSQTELQSVINEYNQRYEGQDMHLQHSVGYKRIPQLVATFNKKWHPQSQKDTFLAVFGLSAWAELTSEEKNKHTIRNCNACHTQHLSLTRAFPDRASRALDKENPAIVFTRQDLTSPTKCGRKVLTELNAICQENFASSKSLPKLRGLNWL